MDICAHFAPTQSIRGCLAGRIAHIDCGAGCTLYQPDPLVRSEEDLKAWSGDAEESGPGDED